MAAARRRTLIRRTAAPLALSLILMTAALGIVQGGAAAEAGTATAEQPLAGSSAEPNVAAGNTLRIDPPAQTVPQNGTFIAHVVQHADVATSGAAATITFDPALLQIQTVTRAAPYADASVFSGASPLAITAANTTGSLTGVAAAFLPPDAVPAGDAAFLDVTFKAIGCGTVQLGLPTGVTDADLLDGRPATYGASLAVSTVGATVATCVTSSPTPSGGVSPSGSAAASGSASAVPTASPTPVPGNSIRIEPASTSVARDATFSVRVVQRSDLATGGVTATIAFDPSILQIVSIAKSAAYTAADLRQSASNDAVTAANASGVLKSVKAEFPTRESVPAGEADFVTVEFRAISCGRTPLLMPNTAADSALLDGRAASYGKALPIRTAKGLVQVCEPAVPSKPTLPSGNSIRLESFYTGVIAKGGFTVRVIQKAVVPTAGITATVLFDPTVLQVVAVSRSPAFAAAPFFQGASAAAISAANASGKLNQVSAAFLAPGNAPAGEAEFISIEFKALACGETPLFVPNDSADSALVDGRPATYGIPLAIQTIKGVVQACDPTAKPTPKPTAVPTDAPITTNPPFVPAPQTPPNTGGGGVPPPPDATSEAPASLVPTATPPPATVASRPTSAPSARPASSAMSTVALVGLGVAGVIGGLLIAVMLAMAMAAGLVIPLIVIRFRTGRRPW